MDHRYNISVIPPNTPPLSVEQDMFSITGQDAAASRSFFDSVPPSGTGPFSVPQPGFLPGVYLSGPDEGTAMSSAHASRLAGSNPLGLSGLDVPLAAPQSPDLSLMSMLPLVCTLGGISGTGHSPVSPEGSPLSQFLPEVDQEHSHLQPSLLFDDGTAWIVGHSPYDNYYGSTGSGTPEYSPFFPVDGYPLSPATSYDSFSSLACTDSRLNSGEHSAANSCEQLPALASTSTARSFSGYSLQYGSVDYLSPTGYENPQRPANAEHQPPEPNSPVPSSAQSDAGSISDVGSPVNFQRVASDAHLLASEKRRRKIAKHSCSFCPQRFTSRDNLMSHEDVHRGVKRFSCEFCSFRKFRTRAVLKRHQKCSRCRKNQSGGPAQ